MTEYERGFIDGIKSKVSAELTPTLINVSKTMLEILKPVLSTALENTLNDNNAITDTDVQPVNHGYWIDDKDYMMCSFCGLSVYDDYYEKRNANSKEYYNFCPYCGAKMIKDGDTK